MHLRSLHNLKDAQMFSYPFCAYHIFYYSSVSFFLKTLTLIINFKVINILTYFCFLGCFRQYF